MHTARQKWYVTMAVNGGNPTYDKQALDTNNQLDDDDDDFPASQSEHAMFKEIKEQYGSLTKDQFVDTLFL